jgi:peptidoglycan/xylan/chitin deacetylase (PgdA/CDA1 family)
MYHAVDDVSTARFRPFAVTPQAFGDDMAYLAASGYQPLTVTQLVDSSATPESLPDLPIVITFDDGFKDFLTTAWPVLQRHSFPATLYVPTAFIGRTATWLRAHGEQSRPVLDIAALRDLASAGVEIGAHSHTHPELDVLDPGRLSDEISRPKRILEDLLARPVRSFAYPYGYHSPAARACVREAGYSSGCTVEYRMSAANDERFALGRLSVEHGGGRRALPWLLHHAAPPRTPWFRRTLTWGWRIVRRGRARLRPEQQQREAAS